MANVQSRGDNTSANDNILEENIGDVVATIDHNGNADNNHNVGEGANDDDNDDGGNVRIGTISSARFNILSTMVGGGCLSLPMAFQQSGALFVGPIMLLVTGIITDFCFRSLVATAVHLNPPHQTRPGKDTFESVTCAAFGPSAYIFSMGLVVSMCFFGAVGYSVLLRDMMEPINDVIAPHGMSDWFHHNFTMFLVILLVTPFCTLRRLTALKDCGAASMASLLILGSCIVWRSVQCNCNNDKDDENAKPWYTYLRYFPESWHDLLNAVPLYISCFVCHYNILTVHNELKNPSPARVSWWLRSTTWFSVLLYMILGFAGSSYAHCTKTGKVQGNILLDFDKNDPLLMVGRMCLAVTITLAFPMLVIPARDIVLRSLILPRLQSASSHSVNDSAINGEPVVSTNTTTINRSVDDELQEPLLTVRQSVSPDEQHQSMEINGNDDDDVDEELPTENVATREVDNNDHAGSNDDGSNRNSADGDLNSAPTIVLLLTSVVIFWSAGTVASVAKSIDIVWDLLGSSLSILLSYLIPAGIYLVITKQQQQQRRSSSDRNHNNNARDWISRAVCWLLLWIFIPLMIVSTGNAIVNTLSF